MKWKISLHIKDSTRHAAMDPLSIAATASGLVFSVVRNGRALATIFEKYKDSQRCIFMIQTECTVLAAALSQLQMVFSKVSKADMGQCPDFVVEAIDLSLTGCTLTMSVLSKELDSLVDSVNSDRAKMAKGKKVKYVWKEEPMIELLQQLRGQSSALSLLLKALDSSSIDQILKIIQLGQPTFQKVRKGAESIRSKNPREKYAKSVIGMTFDDSKTLCSLELSETTADDGPTAPRTSTQLPIRKPAPAPSDTKLSSGETAHVAPLKIVEEDIDFMPWKLNSNEKFQSALDNIRRDASVPALAVGVVSTDAPPNIYVIGQRKQGCISPITRADRFNLGNANPFTTTVLAVLVDRGVFRWDETIVELSPRLANRAHPFHHQTTLSMLGAHCSGLTADFYTVEDGDLIRYLRQVSAEKGRLAVAMSYLARPPDTSPGTVRDWNWANPLLLALAIEDRTSRTFESLIKELVLDPLEMYSAGFEEPNAQRNVSKPNDPTIPWGHKGSTKSPVTPVERVLPLAFSACTGMFCSAPDYALFITAHLRAAARLGTQLYQPGIASCLYTDTCGTKSTLGSWWMESRDWGKGEVFMETGKWDGFAASCWFAPKKGKAYFALANVDGDAGLKITDDAVALAIRHDAG